MNRKSIAIIAALLPLHAFAHPGHGAAPGLWHELGHMGILGITGVILIVLGATAWRRFGR